nr:AtpZ/AtpI family protein [Paracoccus saliphilus]
MADKPQSDADKAADADRLRALEAKLAALTPKPQGPGPMGKYEQANLAWRMVIELVTGLGLGFAVGYGLDYLLGTTPLLMVLFIFLGLAAGIKTMMRTASELDRKSGPAPEGSKTGQAPGQDERD